jgi:hypothetical protein
VLYEDVGVCWGVWSPSPTGTEGRRCVHVCVLDICVRVRVCVCVYPPELLVRAWV